MYFELGGYIRVVIEVEVEAGIPAQVQVEVRYRYRYAYSKDLNHMGRCIIFVLITSVI